MSRSCRSVLRSPYPGTRSVLLLLEDSTVSSSRLQRLLHLNQDCQLVDEPVINLGDVVDHYRNQYRGAVPLQSPRFCGHLQRDSCSNSSSLSPDTEIIRHKAVHMLLQRTDGFHQGHPQSLSQILMTSPVAFICVVSVLFCTDEFIERQSRHLDNTVVEHRLKACVGFSGNGILDLIQCIANARSLQQPLQSDNRLPWKQVQKNGLHAGLPR